MTETPTGHHCQGCGACEGEPEVSYKRRKDPSGVRTLQRIEGPPVVLTRVYLPDIGWRLYCSRCRTGAAQVVARLHADHRTLTWS
jgi:hypothetical protein